MTVDYMALGQHDGWIRLKCFYTASGQYAEFYLYLNPTTRQIQLSAKDETYAPVLIAAFQAAMAAA